MRVLRIEDRQGNGPWKGHAFGVGAYARTYDGEVFENPSLHPSPREEEGTPMAAVGRLGWPQDFVFGCADRIQLLNWFGCPDGRAAMAAAGYHLSIYEIDSDEAVAGRTQVAFPKHRAKLIEQRALAEV